MKTNRFILRTCLIAFMSMTYSMITYSQDGGNIKEQIGPDRDTNYYVYVDKQATFMKGTINDFNEYIRGHLIYPETAQQSNIEGNTTVQFGVNCFGEIGYVKILRSSGNIELDNAAISTVKSSPKWNPAKIGKKYVGQNFVSIIKFNL